jgi:hypothetical protein
MLDLRTAQWRRRFFTDAMLQAASLPNETTPLNVLSSSRTTFPDQLGELSGYIAACSCAMPTK